MTHRIEYLDQAAASDPGRDYKRRMLTGLDLRPGQRVLDVGCGPATDLAAMADAVGDTGAVIGVDNDATMVAEARRRAAADGRQLARLAGDAGFVVGTVDALPVVFRDFEAADAILRLPSVVDRAVRARVMAADAASRWLDRLAGGGPFLAAFTFFVVTARCPG